MSGRPDISTLSNAELQELYWSMPLDTDEAVSFNERIAQELSARKIGIEQVLNSSDG